eukprot:CAMPEP_0202708218 /NCGR_PEP_ID=MMETSP1385-20130828/20456_1 /ASSEMBLY_ACC=CAM_ASM_000861 /TAXON_ID=933848 /ORGANISM="Elphidium margaritaceum" /LENGTH=1487 /DNA_ID=CAMNT_0049367141 /DNA_START=35 /DNA_END=4498 /DNA_ORIENTATION=+
MAEDDHEEFEIVNPPTNHDDEDEDDDDLDPNDPNYPQPKLTQRSSFLRAQSEKVIDPKDFKQKRRMIRKRLSDKQRMPFNRLIERNIHGGLEDELNEKRPMEKSKKILQLNRRLSHRPLPSEIQTDEELPLDLKRADSEYQTLYQYRGGAATPAADDDDDANANNNNNNHDDVRPPRVRTASDPNPAHSEIIKPTDASKNKKKLTSIDNPLDWKFGQRSSTKELQIRGIIPEQYADVVHGNKSLEEAKREWEEYRKKSSATLKNKMDAKFRPSPQDLVDRGIVPDWENPNASSEHKRRNTDLLKMKLSQRMDPDEADQRAIISKDELFSNLDYDEHRKQKEQASKELKSKMNTTLTQRSGVDEVVDRGIVRREYLEDDPEIATNKLREERRTVKQKMQTSLTQRSGVDEVVDRGIVRREYLEEDADIATNKLREQRRSVKQKMQQSLLQRSGVDEVVDRGIVRQEYFDDDVEVAEHKLRAQRTSIKQTMNKAFGNRPDMSEMQQLMMLQEAESDPPQPKPYQPPVSAVAGNLTSPSFDGYSGALPTTPEHDELRADVQDDGDLSAFPTFLDRLKAEKAETSKTLQEHMRRRSTIEELQTRGILPMQAGDYEDDGDDDDDTTPSDDGEPFVSFLDRMKKERTEHRKSIKLFHRRRPTLEDLKERGIYKDATKKDDDGDGDGDSLPDAEAEEDSSDDSKDAEPTFLDRMREEKKQKKKKLANFHRRRPTQEDLVQKGIVAAGEFDTDNMQLVLDAKHQRRESFTSELAGFFQQRPDIAQMLTKGLIAAEFIGMDSTEMEMRRQAIQNTLNNKLNKKRRPTMDDLELRGIVPAGYFNDAQKAVTTKHSRRLTAEKDLASLLPKRMDPKRMFERGMIPQHQFQNIVGMRIPIPQSIPIAEAPPHEERKNDEEDDDEDEEDDEEEDGDAVRMNDGRMTKQQQAFSAGALGPAGVYATQLLKQTLAPAKKRDSKVRASSSGLANIVRDLPHHADTNLFNHDNWTQNLYESLLGSLRFGAIFRRIESLKNDSSGSGNDQHEQQYGEILSQYQTFERMHHTEMNGLQREKKVILDQIEECDAKESECLSTLENLMMEHSALEQKIRPQMKMVLHKMSLVEARIAKLNSNGRQRALRSELEHELHYYDTYMTELKNVFIHTNNIRAKYQNSLRAVIEHKSVLDSTLQSKEQDIVAVKQALHSKLAEFTALINSVLTQTEQQQSMALVPANEHEHEHNHNTSPIVDLSKVLDETAKRIDDNLDLLAFRISTIPAADYALRVMELCQLSYVYSSENHKAFFEWFVKFAVQFFVEVVYAHSCFVRKNTAAINKELHQLESIKFIAELTPPPEDNSVSFEQVLFSNLCVIHSYLQLLPSNDNDDDGGVDAAAEHQYETVIFHVARYLAADSNFSQFLSSQKDEDEIPRIAQDKVKEWIATILQSALAKFTFSADYTQINNAQNKPRDIIRATKYDSLARIRPSRTAAIVMDHAFSIHVDG